jgi:hypothetical protein
MALDSICVRAGRDYPGPTNQAGDAKTSFPGRALFAAEWGIATVGPKQKLIAVVGGIDDNRVARDEDKQGKPFDGGSIYRLHVPPNAPVRQFWSATAYDRTTHGLIRDLPWSSRSSQTPGLSKNADGSVDIYFGAKSPEGKESNWVPSKPGEQFEVLFRFYGPERALFEKTWKLPDIEEAK